MGSIQEITRSRLLADKGNKYLVPLSEPITDMKGVIMNYWYRLSDADRFKSAVLNNYRVLPAVPIYEETADIVRDFEENQYSDWWFVTMFSSYDIADFKSRAEAETELYAVLGNEIYCIRHDC